MKRATITMDGSGRVAVPSDIANVWMSEMELVTLFDVIAPTLRAAVRAVYRSGVLQSCEVERLCLRKDRQMLWLSLGETSFYLCPNPTQTCLCDA